MRFRFVIDHRQLAGMIAGVLLLGLLSFLGGLSVGLILQPPAPAPVTEAVAETPPDDPEPHRETAVGPVEVSPGATAWDLGTSLGVGADQVPGVGEGRAAELASRGELSGPDGAPGTVIERRADRRSERSEVPGRIGDGGWQPRSAFWRAFDRHLDPEAEPGGEMGRRRGASAGLDLSFVEGQAVPRVRYGDELYRVARDHDLNPALMAAMARVESGYDLRAASHRGALGLMQVTPDTARRFGVDPDLLFEPEANLVAAARYLVWLRERFDDDPVLVLAAYNAGEAAVDLYGGVPNYEETRNYVAKVLDLLGARR